MCHLLQQAASECPSVRQPGSFFPRSEHVCDGRPPPEFVIQVPCEHWCGSAVGSRILALEHGEEQCDIECLEETLVNLQDMIDVRRDCWPSCALPCWRALRPPHDCLQRLEGFRGLTAGQNLADLGQSSLSKARSLAHGRRLSRRLARLLLRRRVSGPCLCTCSGHLLAWTVLQVQRHTQSHTQHARPERGGRAQEPGLACAPKLGEARAPGAGEGGHERLGNLPQRLPVRW
mmetsp:Transcript_77445/g.219161  ORF Transcript_77445/g.219161 Transcript_77445/m.219161 type:complete len:232 (+) Transcript_77445:946-1641(+)